MTNTLKYNQVSREQALQASPSRLLFIDNIRWVMIMLVLSMHAAVTYSNEGGWYWLETATLSRETLILFIFYQSFLQSFFMGLLFFLAGYFVPRAYDSKGARLFLNDRARRLGLPTLVYVFILGPLTEYFVSHSWHPNPVERSFIQEYSYYLIRFRFFGGTGPLWFCAALLIFCLIYALVRQFSTNAAVKKVNPNWLTNKRIAVLVLLTGLATSAVRIFWPKGISFFNMQLCYFPQYILFFIAGIFAYRGNWLRSVPNKYGQLWGGFSIIGGIVLWILLLIAGGAFRGQADLYQGGFHWQSLGLSFWESFVGVGLSLCIIVLFRRLFDHQGVAAKFFSANAFAVYDFHPPILISIAILMHNYYLPPLLKFVLLTIFSIIASFAISGLLIRRIPVLKRIL